ncbi:hypothetical protein ACHAPT_010228 [Fusarium lateritium]
MVSISRADARAHIEHIEQEYMLECHGRSAEIITKALEILSCELYDTSIHFVQELLQNADDNIYDCETPMLRFVYKPGSLRVDCNERGFNASNVDAICTIRQSTKAGQKGYTGEKGIGFKSVFKAADVVWISSGAYSFNFDKRRRFGMIAPSWAEFPEPVQEGYTSFYLQLSPQFDENELVETLLHFDATQMLFLRRLRHVKIEVTSLDGLPCTKYIHRTDACEDGNAISYLETGNIGLKYLVYKHRVTDLPTEAKRPGCTDSDLVLAFPFLDHDQEPHSEPQMVYAGLPIGNTHGLKFLLHGDFLLTANRLHIDISLPWNQALRDGLTEALLGAIVLLNESFMRYCWPFFIDSNDKISAFFEQAMTAAVKELKTKCLLESLAKMNAKPSDLLYVDPERFVDEDGAPLTWHEQAAGLYLSTNYPLWAIDSIQALGVRPLSEEDFLLHLTTKIGLGLGFPPQPPKWHSALAKALLSLVQDPKYKQRLRSLRIIPLSNGTWTSASREPAPMLMSEESELAGLPVNDSIPIVDPEAVEDQARRGLFRALDIMSVDSTRLCEWICDQHGSDSFKPRDWTTSQLVGHARLLYESGWAPVGRSIDLWFATDDGGRCIGSELYMRPTPGARTFHASDRVFNVLKERFSCIHPGYFSAELHSEADHGSEYAPYRDLSQAHFPTYLTTTLQVAQIPRLVKIDSLTNGFELSDEFRFLVHKCPAEVALHVLLGNWPSYSKWLEMSGDTEKGEPALYKADLVAEIGKWAFKTSHGTLRLRDTVVPGLDPFIDDTMLPVLGPYLRIAESEDEQGLKTMRQRLSLFRVITENTLRFYLACLTYLSGQSSPDTETVAYVYEQIQSRYDEGEEEVEDHFSQHKLIYVESKSAGRDLNGRRWVDIETCRRLNIDLESQYPRSNRLFRCLLATGGLTLAELVQKATRVTPATDPQRILQTFTDISKVLPVTNIKRASHTLKPLHSEAIFPVEKAKGTKPRLMALKSQNWFIADRPHLRGAFIGIVELLVYAPRELKAIEELINTLGLNSRKLSIVVKSENRPSGRLKLDNSHTEHFAKRSHFIQALIPKSHPRHEQLSEEIEHVQVSTATKVSLTHTLDLGDSQVIGRPDRSLVACSAIGGTLRVFITEECNPSRLPVPEIVQMLSDHFEIKDPAHLGLLYTLFNEKAHKKIEEAFARQGFELPAMSDNNKELPSMKRYYRSLVSIPSPFKYEDHRSEDSDDSGPWFGMRSLKRSVRNGVRTRPSSDKDRRLPILYLVHDHSTLKGEDQAGSLVGSVGDLSERMISQHFERHLGKAYDPAKHWTSPRREQSAPVDHQDASPFTLGGPDLSDQVTDFLMKHGISNIEHWHTWKPTFHFELVVSTGGLTDSFRWKAAQLTRALELRLPNNPFTAVRDVMVLIRISNIYTQPEFQFFVDPWDLLSSGRIRFDKDSEVSATIQEASPDSGTLALSNGINVGSSSYMNAILQPYPVPVNGPTAYGGFIQPSLASSPIKAMSWDRKGKYSYKGLKKDEIRLLVLFPGQDGDLLRGEIYSTPFEQAGSYAAVSYVWGQQTVEYKLLTPDGTLHIHASLFHALVRLRKPTEVTVLWADGICINQKDNHEKSHQVELLPHIFQNASVTAAMLGYGSLMGPAVEALKALRETHVEDPESAELMAGNAEYWESIWVLIVDIFKNLWFRRAWIVQEAVASPEVVFFCGSSTINWKDLFAIMRTLDQHQPFPADVAAAWAPFRTLSWLRSWEMRQTRWSVLLLLETFREVKSSLTRDRFFALLGISSDGNLPGFTPDYECPLEVVVCSFARALVAQGMGMQLLFRAGMGSQPHRFPSWIPDWTVPKLPSLSNSRDRGVVFKACGSTKERIACPEADKNNAAWGDLEVEGYIVDSIKCVSKASNKPEAWDRYFTEVDAMIDQLRPVLSTDIRQKLKRQVPIAEAKHPQVALPEGLDLDQSYKAFRKILKKQNFTKKYEQQRISPASSGLVPNAEPQEISLVAKSKSYESLLDGSIKGWRFATTKSHVCGIVPNNVQEGDVVVILAGGSVPFVVRKSSARKANRQK